MTRPTLVAAHPNSEMYGSDRMFLASVERLAHDYDVVAVLPQDGLLGEALRGRGIEPVVMDFPVLRKVNMKATRAPFTAMVSGAAVLRLARWLRSTRAETVYVSTVITPVWVLAARRAGCRVVCHVHENEPEMPSWKRRILLAPLRACDAVIANSGSTAEWILSGAPSVAERTAVVYNGVTVPTVTKAVELGPAKQHIVVVGRLSHRKGQDVVLRTLHRLRAVGADVDLTFVGSVYPGYEHYEGMLIVMAAEMGLTPYVQFAGYRDNPHDFMAAADVVVVPSRMEPFGNVAVEAQLLGTPVAVSSVQGLLEIVQGEETGMVAHPDDELDLAEAIGDILADPTFASELAAKAQAAARERFSPEQYAEALAAAVGMP